MREREEKDVISGHIHVGGEDAVDQVQLGQEERALQLVVVEGDLPGPGAVQTRLHEGGPGVLQEEASPNVVLADPSSPGEHCLPAVMLHSIFSEEEVGEVPDVIGGHEIGFCKQGTRKISATTYSYFSISLSWPFFQKTGFGLNNTWFLQNK